MAGTSLFALIDDIATLLDDVAVLSKVAARKTAGVLGDDLALNAEQVAGVNVDRELPVVWAVAKGSAVNKAILAPMALALGWLAPWAVLPLLMVGGLYLCFEGFEKVAHKFLHDEGADAAHERTLMQAAADATIDLVALEKEKIRGAIRTDFVLSAEIIVITLGALSEKPDLSFATRLGALAVVSVLMTVGVYGLVALIVKLDDMGLALVRGGSSLGDTVGRALILGAPMLLKFLSVAGTIAMFLVGGGILAHGVHGIESMLSGWLGEGFIASAATGLAHTIIGLAAGGLTLLLVVLGRRLIRR